MNEMGIGLKAETGWGARQPYGGEILEVSRKPKGVNSVLLGSTSGGEEAVHPLDRNDVATR